jgi:MYXO-CTERM domain-containing protein
MQKLLIALTSTLLAAPTALAAVETHAVPYTYSLSVNGDDLPPLHFPGFDDMNGQRTLTRVDVRVQGDVSATLGIENMTAAPLSGWSLEGEHLVFAAFMRDDPKNFGPFAFLGGLSIEPFTGTLAPTDGTPRSGPDYLAVSDSISVDSTLDMDPSFLEFFSGGGEVSALVGPFVESLLDGATLFDPKSGTGEVTAEFTELAQAGTLSVIYPYASVPEPTGLLTLAAAAVLAARRRRS